LEIITLFTKTRKNVHLVNHQISKGLAESYNEGIALASGEIIVFMHQDILLESIFELRKLLLPFNESTTNSSAIASGHTVIHPVSVWKTYPFWQKCLFSRHLNKEYFGIDGKFDAFSRSVLITNNCFDSRRFRTAGEDGDLIARLGGIGVISPTSAKIVHLHRLDNNFNYLSYLMKHYQYARAQGTLLRLRRIKSYKHFISAFHREILLFTCLLPFCFIIGLVGTFAYSVLYTINVNKYCPTDPRTLVLPIANIFSMFASLYGSLCGFISARQK